MSSVWAFVFCLVAILYLGVSIGRWITLKTAVRAAEEAFTERWSQMYLQATHAAEQRVLLALDVAVAADKLRVYEVRGGNMRRLQCFPSLKETKH